MLLRGKEKERVQKKEIKKDHNKKNIKAIFYLLNWLIDS